MSVRLCWHCITWLRQNHSNSTIRHLRSEKGTGAEMRPAIVSGILSGDTRLSLCFKTRVQSHWYENDFLYLMRRKLIFQLTNFLHLALLFFKVRFFLELANGLFYRKSLNKNDQDHILRARETEHPTQTLVRYFMYGDIYCTDFTYLTYTFTLSVWFLVAL